MRIFSSNKTVWFILLFIFVLFVLNIFYKSRILSNNLGKISFPKLTKYINSHQNPIDQKSITNDTVSEKISKKVLTFNDDFDSFNEYLDPQGKVTCAAGGNGTWQTIYHFCDRTSSSNKEAEIYVDKYFLSSLKKQGRSSTDIDKLYPFEIKNGILKISAQPSSREITTAVGKWAKYTSGLISTQFSFSQAQGYFEARIKLPRGNGLWPAFWLLPSDRTWPPEIDILEAFGGPNKNNEGGVTKLHYAVHSPENTESCGGWIDSSTDLTSDFHVYGVDIRDDFVTYFLDNKEYARCKSQASLLKPFFILINLAVGGKGSWPGEPNKNNVWPATMEIDYVRAYQFYP